MKAKVAIRFCPTYELDRLEVVLNECFLLLGGLAAFFKPGAKALIKPNLLTDAKPEEGITTHPNFVQAVVRILKKYGLGVAIADIPAEFKLEANPESVYKVTGMRQVAEKEGIRLLSESRFMEENGVIFSNWVKEFDYIISLPKFKTHSQMTLTGAVKNVFGLTPRLYRVNLHKRYARQDDFAKMLLEIFKKCRPTISLIDGIEALEGNGPARGGILKKLGLVAVSADALALDSILSSIMGLNPEDIATIREGRCQNLGATNLADIDIVGDDWQGFKTGDFKLPPSYMLGRMPKTWLRILGKLAEFRPRVDKSTCNGCRICIENCPLAAIELRDKKAKIDYRKCVDCFCCLEVCPIGAMKTKSGPLIYVLKLRELLRKWKMALAR